MRDKQVLLAMIILVASVVLGTGVIIYGASLSYTKPEIEDIKFEVAPIAKTPTNDTSNTIYISNQQTTSEFTNYKRYNIGTGNVTILCNVSDYDCTGQVAVSRITKCTDLLSWMQENVDHVDSTPYKIAKEKYWLSKCEATRD